MLYRNFSVYLSLSDSALNKKRVKQFQSMKNTKKVTGRATLHFEDLEQMLMHCEMLVTVGTKQLGNWSLGENIEHLSLIQNASIDGFPKLMPWPIRMLASLLVKRMLLKRGFPPSGRDMKTINPAPLTASVALENLRTATRRVKCETKRALNPGFGKLTLGEWNRIYLRHAELHLSFCIPLENK